MESKDKPYRNLAKHTHEMLVEMSHRDSLTGLLNRRGYQEQFELFFKHAQRSGEKLQIIILDVNNFRQVNKRYEHSGGDEALKSVAVAINKTFRDNDAKSRWGGDEFVVLTLNKTDNEALPVGTIIERLNTNLDFVRPKFMNEGELKVTAGLVTWNGKESREELFDRVDKLMMSQKENV